MKATLDRYISTHYQEVFRYTRYFCAKYNPHLTIDLVINNAYLHCIEINDNTTDVNKVKSYLLNAIKRQVLWQNLDTNKQEKVRANELDVPDTIDDDTDLNEKIDIEMKYNEWKGYVDIYRDGLTDSVSITVAKAYFDKGLTTATAMSQHFKIPRTSAHYLIAEIKQKLKQLKYENQK